MNQVVMAFVSHLPYFSRFPSSSAIPISPKTRFVLFEPATRTKQPEALDEALRLRANPQFVARRSANRFFNQNLALRDVMVQLSFSATEFHTPIRWTVGHAQMALLVLAW
jgi:hypothetical protein